MREFHWEIQDNRWALLPSTISVVEIDGYWIIHVGDSPLDARYTSLQGAKLDAWQFAVSKRKALFGEYSIALRQ